MPLSMTPGSSIIVMVQFWSADSPLERRGFEPSVPLQGCAGKGGRRHRCDDHEARPVSAQAVERSASREAVRQELVSRSRQLRVDDSRMFGAKGDVEPLAYLIGAAAGWGGLPPSAAIYESGAVAGNDGQTTHRLTVSHVPVDGFWSISVYNRAGFYEKNDLGAYSINNLTAVPNANGSATIQFGDCNRGIANCLPIMPGWNYTVRLYRPRTEVLSGTWSFPKLQPVE